MLGFGFSFQTITVGGHQVCFFTRGHGASSSGKTKGQPSNQQQQETSSRESHNASSPPSSLSSSASSSSTTACSTALSSSADSRPAPSSPAPSPPPPSSPAPLVFLHGVGMGIIMYVELIQLLAATERPLIVLESPHVSLRACGGDVPTTDQVAGFVAAILAHEGLAQACVVGHSYGALVASRLQVGVKGAFPS
jgi:pimeloyl-ACP methyl ester carboxylesterase